jgi:2-phosphoglycerate kinase
VLSRFLVARTLAAAAVPPAKARKAALALKKRLVDAGVLDVGQEDMERELFAVLEELG